MVQLTTQTGTVEPRSVQRAPDPWLALIAPVLLTMLAGSIGKQGGFYTSAQLYLGVLLAAATVLAVGASALARRANQAVRPAMSWRICLPAALLAGWTLLDASLHAGFGSGLRLCLLVVAVAAVIADCRSLDQGALSLLSTGLILIGTGCGALGWFGVLSHRSAFAITGQGLWRASSTLSYPNAAAVLLAMLAVLGLALRGADRPAVLGRGPVWLDSALTVTLIGLAATLSRGGALALFAGVVVLGALTGWRRLLAAGWAPALGALIAMACLAPSMPSSSQPHYGVAAAGLLVGLLVGTLGPVAVRHRTGRARPAGTAGLIALTVAGCLLLARHSLAAVDRARLNLHSTDRGAALHAVWAQITAHPITGTGPGLRDLSWRDPTGGLRVFAYAHNEYLQLLAELGLIGLICLLGCLVSVLRLLHRWRPNQPADRTHWAAGAAAVAVLLVSVLFDFTGHFPAIPLTAAALVGCAGSAHRLSNTDNTPTMKGDSA